MKTMMKRSMALILTLAVFGAWVNTANAADPTEDKLISDLASPKEGTVTDALGKIERLYPTTTKALPAMEKLLTDPRKKVVLKDAQVLGIIHANVSADSIKAISMLLDSKDKPEVIIGLKSLRGLKAQSTIPKIVPLLQNPDSNIKRDSCRTLAVLGDKSLIPAIKPLLQVPELAVQKDASDAISILEKK